jgi:hypothetical protein
VKKKPTNVLAGVKLLTIRIEDPRGYVMHIFDAGSRDKVLPEIRRALRTGYTVRWENGIREWWILQERVDTSKQGSEQYEWDKAGERVRANLIQYLCDKSGNVTTKIIPGKHFVAPS